MTCAASVVLSDRTTLTAQSSAKRTSSPSRHLTQLRSTQPSIALTPITMPPQPLDDDDTWSAMTTTGRLHTVRNLGKKSVEEIERWLEGLRGPLGERDLLRSASDPQLSPP